MTSSRRSSIFRAIAAAVVGLLLPSCAWLGHHEHPAGEITTVRYYWLDQKDTTHNIADDYAIPFERLYLQWNAYTAKELNARQGHYYAISWKAADRTQPVTVRLEYRQEKTGLAVHTQEQVVSDIHGSNLTRFRVVGDDYMVNGKVICFRVSLLQNKKVIAQRRSYLWEKFEAPAATPPPSTAVDVTAPGTSATVTEPSPTPGPTTVPGPNPQQLNGPLVTPPPPGSGEQKLPNQ